MRLSAFLIVSLLSAGIFGRGIASAAEADLLKQLRAAPKLQTEDLGEPVKSVRTGMMLWTPNPDGKSWDVLQIYFPKYGGPNTIAIIDLGSGQVKTVQTEVGWNFHLCPSVTAPNGKLFISILNGRLQQKICIYDPATNEFKLDAVKMPEDILGETHPLVLGTDGKLYAIGQHPSKAATAVQIDPDTLAVKAYGPIGPSHAPNSCWGYSGGADDRFIYIASGKLPWYLVAYDRQTGKSTTLVETESVGGGVSVGQQADGCTASASRIVGTNGGQLNCWLHEGKPVARGADPKAVPPWPKRAAPPALPLRPEVNTSLTTADANGQAEIWFRAAGAKAGAAQPGASPESQGWKRYSYQVPLYPHGIYRLMELPDQRIMGSAGAYEGNFIYDPATNKAKHLGKIALSHYATTFLDGKVYMSGYPSSPLYVFDPAKPWTAGTLVDNRIVGDQDQRANPRQLVVMGHKDLAGTHKMFAAATGADGKVYFGGQWVRDGACGGMAWYDPKTGKTEGLWRPLSNYQITHMAAAEKGRLIVVSTRRVADYVLNKPTPEQGALFFFDTAKGRLVGRFEPVKRAKGAGPIAVADDTRLVGWTEDPDDPKKSVLYAVDLRGCEALMAGDSAAKADEPPPAVSLKPLFTKSLPVPLPAAIGSNQQEPWDFRLGPDGRIWTFMDNVLVRLDAGNGSIDIVGRLAPAGRLAFSQGKVYLGGTTAIRRIKDIPLK